MQQIRNAVRTEVEQVLGSSRGSKKGQGLVTHLVRDQTPLRHQPRLHTQTRTLRPRAHRAMRPTPHPTPPARRRRWASSRRPRTAS